MNAATTLVPPATSRRSRPAAGPPSRSTRGFAAVTIVGAAAATGAGLAFGPEAAIAPLAAMVAVLTVRGFESIAHLAIASVFVESVSLGGGARVGRVVAAAGVAAIVARVLLTDWRPRRLPAWTWAPSAVFVTWVVASGFWAGDTAAWSERMQEFALAGAYFLVFALFVDSPAMVRRLLRTFAIGACLAAALAIVQGLSGARAVGLQGDPNLFALYQVMAVPACAALARSSVARPWVWQGALVPIAASVLATQSRGGAITLAVVMAAILLRRDGAFFSGTRRMVVIVAVVVGVGGLLFVGGEQVTRRFDPDRVAVDRASARIDIWRVAWRAAVREPVHGLGAGNFQSQSIELLEREPGVELAVSHHLLLGRGPEVHNVYLETFVDYGAVGAAAYLAILVAAFAGLRRLSPRVPNSVLAALGVMLAAFCVATIFLSILNAKLLWATIGMIGALAAATEPGVVSGPAKGPA